VDKVKLIECSQASSRGMSHTRLFKAQAKRHAVRSGPSNVARREQSTAGVQSGPKSIPYRMQNMETLFVWATLFVAAPTARPGSRDSIEKTAEAKAGV
jgi:hypothetical protein